MKDFIQQFTDNRELQNKVFKARSEAEKAGKTPEEYTADLVKIINAEGIDASYDDVLAFIKEKTKVEIPEEELDAVAGGKCGGEREKCCTKKGSCCGICADGSSSC